MFDIHVQNIAKILAIDHFFRRALGAGVDASGRL